MPEATSRAMDQGAEASTTEPSSAPPALEPLLVQRLHNERTAAGTLNVDCWACEAAQSLLVRDLSAAFDSAWDYAADSQAELAHLRSLLARARDLLRQGRSPMHEGTPHD